MILFDNKEKIIKFIICINILLLILLVVKNLFNNESYNERFNQISTSTIKSEDKLTTIYVEYPRFNKNDEINKIITDMIYSYIKEFKNDNSTKSLDITYKTYYINNFINIVFHIENTLSNIKYKNIIIDLDNSKVSYISSLYDKDYLENEIKKLVYNKYQTEIYNKISNENINNFTYIISDESIEVYFNNIDWENIDYIPYIIINLSEETTYINSDNENKYIAFTYDDGPSDNTLELLNILEENNSSATFFVVGNNIKGKEDVIKKIYNSNSEVGSHGYTHMNFNTLNSKELNNEINSTNILFNSITNDKITLIRPPYGDYNDDLFNLNYKIILWNIDSKDWLLKDEDKIYNNVIKNACDGCIVLMHDRFPESIKATKKLIPELNNLGYNVVSISKLMEIKNYKSKINVPISYIK